MAGMIAVGILVALAIAVLAWMASPKSDKPKECKCILTRNLCDKAGRIIIPSGTEGVIIAESEHSVYIRIAGESESVCVSHEAIHRL